MASDTWAKEYESLKKIERKNQASIGYCYIVHLENNEVKIGFVHKKDRLVPRWKEISLDLGYKVHPVSVQSGGFFREQFLHSIYNPLRISGPGERFKLSPDLKHSIDGYRFNPLVSDQIAEWYGPNFLVPQELARVEKTSHAGRAIGMLKQKFPKHIQNESVGDQYVISGLTEIQQLHPFVRKYITPSRFLINFLAPEIPRNVWDMEF